jgi:hypothetical protein
MDFKLNTVPPAPPTEEPQVEPTNSVEPTEPVAEPTVETPTIEEPPKDEPPKVDEFIENLNKRFGTQFKADDEIKQTFGLQKTVDEYQTKLKESEELIQSIDDYKKKIEELEEAQDPLKYFASPQTYVAEQLRIKYPKSNPVLLQEIATTDVNKLGDLDVLVKDKQLFVNDPPKESVIRSVILKKYGIDPTSPSEEWDEISVAEMKLDAAAARDKINGLKEVIEMPKVISKEDRQKAEAEALAQKEQAIAPLKETFSKFDKFVSDGFEFDVPDEYKSKLPDMFQSMFINAGLEPNEENLQSALELREALLLRQYFPKIKEVIAKEAETKLQAKMDAELHNTQPPNTTTLTDHQDVNTPPGLSKFLTDQGIK